ncbi:MAG: 3-oxoacyl-[acyl-carrier-protein] reductase [bacterium]|nr:3-oxoacyl-[acyl-carrier-protein] reductase [bacterium]
MFRLDGKTALVTGASQGIGRAIARRLATQGAKVVLAARGVGKLEALAEEIRDGGGQALPLGLDVSQTAGVAARLRELPADFAEVDILVNNAGITRDSLLARMSLEQWEEVLTTNLTGSFAVTREFMRSMIRRRWGRVIFISSVVGLMGNIGQVNYGASKAGMIGFSKSLAREMGSRGVTSNVVAPGFIETAMTEEMTEQARKDLSKTIVMRRFGTAEEVAATTLFLASEEAGYITGEVINVSGGMYI